MNGAGQAARGAARPSRARAWPLRGTSQAQPQQGPAEAAEPLPSTPEEYREDLGEGRKTAESFRSWARAGDRALAEIDEHGREERPGKKSRNQRSRQWLEERNGK